jgi:signal transduction histidine kinase
MRNDSDDRGAKLLTGSPYWTDYSIDADVQLLGLGDAGLAARVSDAETGVDAYSGYYAGFRTVDNALVIGRVQHGFEEYPIVAVPGGVQPFHWYHLSLTVKGCQVTATATVPGIAAGVVTNSVSKADCFHSGRAGLRSYTSGGVWRNVAIRSANGLVPAPAHTLSDLPIPSVAVSPRILLPPYFRNTFRWREADAQSLPAQAISSLRFAPVVRLAQASVRGLVVSTRPRLYIQDATAGVAVEPSDSPPLKIGDEVEATGRIEPHGFSATLHDARVRLLWEGGPAPPLSVTANQAATGAFDAMFIQVEGRLTGKSSRKDGGLVLDLENGPQSFRALVSPGLAPLHLQKLQAASLLRLRGVCVVDSKFTKSLTPFVLLLRSSEDVEEIAGPPWWSPSSLIPLGIGILIALAVGYNVYLLAKHWRLRAIIEERGRLAHEIHDTLAQSFAGIGFQLEAIRNSMPADSPLLERQVHLACDLARHSHEEARRSIASLRPESLELAALGPALQECADRMVQHGDVTITAVSEGSLPAIPLRIKDTLFRIGQEAIANAIRHASPATVGISVRYRRSSIRLRVEDNGSGFRPEDETRGFGLIGMRRRAESISAVLSITSNTPSGTLVEVCVPLPARLTFTSWPVHIWRQWKGDADRRNHSYSYRG